MQSNEIKNVSQHGSNTMLAAVTVDRITPETMKIKAIYIKNLKLSEGKVASQVAHAVKNLGTTPTDCDIIVLGVSTTKFNELTAQHECYIQRDKGLTEVENGTATAAAWIDVP